MVRKQDKKNSKRPESGGGAAAAPKPVESRRGESRRGPAPAAPVPSSSPARLVAGSCTQCQSRKIKYASCHVTVMRGAAVQRGFNRAMQVQSRQRRWTAAPLRTVRGFRLAMQVSNLASHAYNHHSCHLLFQLHSSQLVPLPQLPSHFIFIHTVTATPRPRSAALNPGSSCASKRRQRCAALRLLHLACISSSSLNIDALANAFE